MNNKLLPHAGEGMMVGFYTRRRREQQLEFNRSREVVSSSDFQRALAAVKSSLRNEAVVPKTKRRWTQEQRAAFSARLMGAKK